MSDRCDVSGKKVKGFSVIMNHVEESNICSTCFDKLGGMKVLKKYESKNEVQQEREMYITKAKELSFPENVVQSMELHFENKKKDIISKEEILQHIVTTTPNLEGYKIEEYLGIVADQCVLGTGMFSGLDASIADLTGSESSAYSEKLDLARQAAQIRAIRKSMKLGGNAIVGANLEFSVFPNAMIGIIFKGTAVKVKKIENE